MRKLDSVQYSSNMWTFYNNFLGGTMKSYIAIYLEKMRSRKEKNRLRNSNFSIISSNCVGGVIYHKLGLKFLSPTINLWIRPNDYLKFLKNLNYYLSAAKLTEDKKNHLDYPVGFLGNGENKITLYFQHYSSFTEAVEKWNKRKIRINFDNLFVIMTDRDGVDYNIMKQFDQLPYRHKVILTGKVYPNIKSSLCIPNCLEAGHLGDVFKANFLTGKSKIDEFDFVKFLNGDGC